MKENIEEDIKILENFTEQTVLYGSTVGMTLEKYIDLQLSIKHILSDYKRVLKENEELKSKNKRINGKIKELNNKINKVINKMNADKMEQFDDYVIYLIESYLKILEE